MRWFYKLLLRLRSLLRKGLVEQELSEELRFHLGQLISEKVARGMTQEEARYSALRELGGVEQIKEECRDMRRVNYIENFLQDVRYRLLRRNLGFTPVAVLSLALGVGSSTALYSIIYGAFLHPFLNGNESAVLLRGMSKADALRSAQLSLIADLRGGRLTVKTPLGPVPIPEIPRYWAGFVLRRESMIAGGSRGGMMRGLCTVSHPANSLLIQTRLRAFCLTEESALV
jgi:hypothetical protein